MRVDCDDCSLNFQTKKLYIKHLKSKECTKKKRTKSPIAGSGQPSKKPRLEIIPQSNYSPTQITQIQSQISQLTQKQKEQLQQQLSQKHKQVLQSIPLSGNQLPTSRVIISKNGERKEVVTVGSTLSVTPISAPNKSRRTYSRNTATVMEVRIEDVKDDLPLVTEFTFSNEPIAAVEDDDVTIVSTPNPIDEGEPVSYGSIKIKAIAKAFINIANVIPPSSNLVVGTKTPIVTLEETIADAVSDKSVTPTATPKETCPHCRKIFSKSGISQHIEYKHKTICEHCDQRLLSDEVEAHVDREHKSECKYCMKRFLKLELSNHISVHMDDCKKCKQRFPKSEIDQHVRNIHEKEACPDCPQRFDTKELLENHNYEEHLVEHCEECPKRFKEVEELVDHSITVHPKEQCDECDLVFGLKKDLDEHKDKDHSKIMKFNGGMFMMMLSQEDDEMEVDEEEDGQDTMEREMMEREELEEERQKQIHETMTNIVRDLADDIVKNAMTGTILFALRIDN